MAIEGLDEVRISRWQDVVEFVGVGEAVVQLGVMIGSVFVLEIDHS